MAAANGPVYIMANDTNRFQAIISHCKEYGFIFPSSEIYDGLSAVYDYGQWGSELKKNIKDHWWKSMTQLNENVVGIDAAIFMHPTTWKASGHVDSFSDPMIDNKDSKKRYRVDHLIEARIEELEKEGKNTEAAALQADMDRLLAASDLAGLKALIESRKIKCSVSGTCNWTDVRDFNLMFSTQLGSVSDEASEIYLRPETAQGIFVNFLNVQKTGRMKIPFGIAQIGKAFRNEIVARQFIFRMREFEQMEMQYFVKPGTEMAWYEKWKEKRMKWHQALGLGKENYRFHDHLNLAHYANAACDIQFNFPMGFKELEGIHSGTHFDLKSHESFAGKKLQYFETEPNQSYVPYVVETSVGLDRLFLSILSNSYKEEKLASAEGEEGNERVVLSIPAALAPYKIAVLPLVKKDGLDEKAKSVFDQLKSNFRCYYEEKDTIGRRYRRMDAIGTPYCVTIDHQTLQENTVTVRERDTMKQERVSISSVQEKIQNSVSINELLKKV